MSKSRKPIAPDLGIFFPKENFSPPLCQPPRGKDVLERFQATMELQLGNQKDVKIVA